MSEHSPSTPLHRRLYGWLLWAYSPRFRHEFGEDLVETFDDSYRVARHRGRLAVFCLAGSMVLDLLVSATADRLKSLRRSRAAGQRIIRKRSSRMDRLLLEARHAVRALRRAPAFTAVAVATLALGIGANTAIFSLINEVLLRPLPIVDPGRAVRLYTSDYSSGLHGGSSYPDYVDFRQQIDGLEDLAAFSFSMPVNLRTDLGVERVASVLVSGNFFSVLGVRPRLGRLFEESDEDTVGGNPVAVLSHTAWQSRFGAREDIAGLSMTLNGHPFTIIGVAPEGFNGVVAGEAPELWLPLTMFGQALPSRARVPLLEMRGARWLSAVGRLEPGATLSLATTQATAVMARLAEEFPRSNRGTLQQPDQPRPITLEWADDAALGFRRAQQGGGGVRSEAIGRAGLLLGIVGFVLLIACANVANLLLVRSNRRSREMAVRLALGAGRGQVARQLLVESTLLSLVGGALGLGLASVLGRVLLPLGLPAALTGNLEVRDLALDGRVLGFAFLVSLLTGILFGVLPALHAARPNLVPALRGTPSFGGERAIRFGTRELLVVFQVASSLVLLVGAGLFLRSTIAAYGTELGFNSRGVLLASFDVGRQGLDREAGIGLYRRVLERIRSLPGVDSASLSAVVPVQAMGSRRNFAPEGYEAVEGEDLELNFNLVSAGFFKTLEIPFLEGRGFSDDDDAEAPLVAVVNETFATRFWPGERALGKRIRNGPASSPAIEVVGLVADSKYRAVREEPMPYVYLPLGQSYRDVATLAVRSARPEALLKAVRSEIEAIDPTMPLFEVHTLRQQLDQALSQERGIAAMITSLGCLALLLAAVGIYAVMAYTVVQRTQEIGVRSALGANRLDLLRSVLGRGGWLTLAGVIVGCVVALGLGQLIDSLIVDISPSDPLTFVLVVVLLGVVAMVACLLPARRASRVDPVKALRYE